MGIKSLFCQKNCETNQNLNADNSDVMRSSVIEVLLIFGINCSSKWYQKKEESLQSCEVHSHNI